MTIQKGEIYRKLKFKISQMSNLTLLRNKNLSEIKKMQLNKDVPFFKDRLFEIIKHYKKTEKDIIQYFKEMGVPTTREYVENLHNFFEGKTLSDKELFDAYAKSSFHYICRIMLAYERYSEMIPHIEHMEKSMKIPVKDWKIMDYGCGVSDQAIVCAVKGSKVTLVDLDTPMIKFTKNRYTYRKCIPKIITLNSIDEMPKKLEQYDVVVCSAVFEHVRNPLKLLKFIHKHIKKGGYLIDIVGTDFDIKAEGDHLPEAVDQILNSTKFQDYHGKHFKQEGFNLWKKIK